MDNYQPTDHFRKQTEMDCSALCALAFRLSIDSASPFFVPDDIAENYEKDVTWKDGLECSSGGIKNGQPYVQLSLGGLFSNGNTNEGFNYSESELMEDKVPCLVKRPYIELLACLVAHEVAHAVVYYIESTTKAFEVVEAHGDIWQKMYRYLRTNLLIIVNYDLLLKQEQWGEVYTRSISALSSIEQELVTDFSERTFVNDSGCDEEYGLCRGIELYLEHHWLERNFNQLTALSTISYELMGEDLNL